MRQREEEVRALKLELAELERQLNVARKKTVGAPGLAEKAERLAEELAALQRGDSIIATGSDANRSRSLLLHASPTGSMLQLSGGDWSVEQGPLLSAQGIRRTERVASELFALRKASDECVPLLILRRSFTSSR